MKKLTILRSVLLALFGVLAINLDLAFGDVPLQSKANWLRIIPALAILAALVGLVVRKELVRKELVRKELVRKELVRKELVRKELKAAESATRKAKAELAPVYASVRFADLPRPASLG